MKSICRKKVQSSPYLVLIILLAAALVLPFGYALDLGPGPNSIRALIWEYVDAPWFSGVRLVRIGQILEGIFYTLPVYFYIVRIFHRYRTGSKPKSVAALGLLGALFPGLVSLVRIVGWLQGWTQPPPPLSDHYFPIYVPLPITVILTAVMMKLFPVANNQETENS